MSEVLDGFVYSKEFSVICRVLLWAGLSFREKKARGCQMSFTYCCRAAPRAESDASVTMASLAWLSGCANSAAWHKLSLHSAKASCSTAEK